MPEEVKALVGRRNDIFCVVASAEGVGDVGTEELKTVHSLNGLAFDNLVHGRGVPTEIYDHLDCL